VVINEGRVEQVGTPDQLYDEPANDFVMGFLGEITRLGDSTLRPHDIDLSVAPSAAGAREGQISRLLRVGFEVRATVLTVEGQEVSVVLTRATAHRLGLEEGMTVWLTPPRPMCLRTRDRAFSGTRRADPGVRQR
jgi:sulfate transport system ATP-binding protein